MSLHCHDMSEREQMVWAAVYAQTHGDPGAVVHFADQAVHALRSLAIDEQIEEPETALAQAGLFVERAEFDPWYRLAYRLAHPSRHAMLSVTDEMCEAAYEGYQRSRGDFY
jgi:hypothetical protein